MDESRAVLRRVGLVLVIVGLADVALMIYCIATSQAYASSLNLFAVAGGIFLLRGSLAAARLVATFASFLFGAMATLLLAVSILVPLGFVATLLRVHPLTTAVYFIAAAGLVGFLWWTFRSLTVSPVTVDVARASLKPIRLLRSAALGAALVVVLMVVVQTSVRTDAAREALAKIQREHGAHQRYFVSSFQSSGGAVEATVIGYTDREINTYAVSWNQ
jgi:hypothetical protein